MQIAKVEISNFMGIEHLEFEAGLFNVAEGGNGKGKTSFFKAIKFLIEGSEDATLLRRGAKTGEAILVMNDGTTVSRRITQKAVQPLVIEKNGVKVAKPASVMKQLTDLMSVNPIAFLQAPKKERVNVLLDSLPIQVSADRLAEIVGEPVKLNPATPPFVQIDQLRQSVFEDRTGTNRALNDKRATIDQLTRTLPESEEEIQAEDETGLLAEIDSIDAAKDTEIARIDGKLTQLRSASDQAKLTIRSKADADVAALQEQISTLSLQVSTRRAQLADDLKVETDAFGVMESKANQQKQITLTRHSEKRGGVSGQLTGIRERAQQAARYGQTRETIDALDDEATQLQLDSDRQTTAINGIDAYKSELLSALPVSGLEVREGEIFRDGIVFDRLNTQQQVSIAVEVAKLRAGELGIICVDGLEILDTAHMEEFQAQVMDAGLQAFVTRVIPEGELSVTSTTA